MRVAGGGGRLDRGAREVFIVSDGTGITAETLAHSLLSQFPAVEFTLHLLPYVNTTERALETASLIDRRAREAGSAPLVFTTFADDTLHAAICGTGARVFDFFGAFIGPLEEALATPSSHTTGRSHAIGNVEEYTSRISAIDYTMQCDDGVNIVDYDAADLLLVGVSRSGKTPTCLYLALHYGLRAANYPLVEDDFDRGRLPEPLQGVRERLYGLTIQPFRLQQIRQERRPNSRYCSLAQCRREVAAAEALFRAEHIPYLDTTSVSIEEISTTIMDSQGLYRG